MGGPAGVDAAARGGGTTIIVPAMDAQSFSGWMGDRGGSGLTRTLQENRGEYAQQFRRLRRR